MPAPDLPHERRSHDRLEGSFDAVATELVSFLADVTGMRQWTVNRKADNAYVVLAASPAIDGLVPGARLPWSETICARMAEGTGPRLAGALDGTVYEVGRTSLVQSYFGAPLLDGHGAVLGTLSGTDSRPRHDLEVHRKLVDVTSHLIAELLIQQNRQDAQSRSLERAVGESETDALTGLPNRRAWDRVMISEQRRLEAHHTQTAVVVIDLDGLKEVNDNHGHVAGDQLLRKAGMVLASALRQHDFVARTGGDEFAVVLGETTLSELDEVVRRLREQFDAAGVAASVGSAVTGPGTLDGTWEAADRAMYVDKSRRTGNRRDSTQFSAAQD